MYIYHDNAYNDDYDDDHDDSDVAWNCSLVASKPTLKIIHSIAGDNRWI